MTGEIRGRGRPRGRLKRHYPPNCTLCDLGPSRFLAFRAKQREVEAKYGFRLGVPCRTPEQREGHRRYMSDWQRRYRAERPVEERRAYMNAWHLRKRLEKRLGRAPTEDEIAAEIAAKEERRVRHEERCVAAKERYGFTLGTVPLEMSLEEAEARKRYENECSREWRKAHAERVRELRRQSYQRAKEAAKRKREAAAARREKCLAALAKARERQRELREEAKRLERERRRRDALERFGCDIDAKPRTAEERRAQNLYWLTVAREKCSEQRARRKKKREEAERRKREAARTVREKRIREREEAQAARVAEIRNARETFAAEREANRAAYLAAKAERGERGAGNGERGMGNGERGMGNGDPAAVPRSPSFIIPPVEPPGGKIGTGGGDDDDWERRMREEAEQAARKAKEAEREASRKAKAAERQAAKQAKQEARKAEAAERESLLKQAYAKFAYKVTAYKNGLERARRSMGLPTKKRKWTPEERKRWSIYLRESRKEFDDWLVGRMRRDLDKAARAKRREHRRLVSEGKAEPSAEQLERQKRQHDKQMAYNREYRRRKRAEALAAAQAKWTPAQWAEWEKRQAAKNRHTPAWLVGEVVKRLAAESGVSADDVTARLIECGGIDFLMAGAESMGRSRLARRGAVDAAVRALMFHIDPDHATMFEGRPLTR